MNKSVKIEFSSELFGGYGVWIVPEEYNSSKEVIDYCRNKLYYALGSMGFRELALKAKSAQLHIHDFDIFDLRERNRDVFYLCHSLTPCAAGCCGNTAPVPY